MLAAARLYIYLKNCIRTKISYETSFWGSSAKKIFDKLEEDFSSINERPLFLVQSQIFVKLAEFAANFKQM